MDNTQQIKFLKQISKNIFELMNGDIDELEVNIDKIKFDIAIKIEELVEEMYE